MDKGKKRAKNKAKGGSFGSFDALRRAKGDAPKDEPKKDGPGWTLETDVPVNLEEIGEPLEVRSLDRVANRPNGFGPMAHGPACYADVESEEMQILHSFRCRTLFPGDVAKEMRSLPPDPTEEDKRGRLDLRGETIFTIDGADAKDYDDAIGIKPLANGAYEVGVHIADVAHYVRPGTALDDEALARATSVYVADQVVPMLPEELSNNLCSLVPKRDRLAYSVIMEFDAAGERTSARVAKSVIKSVQRNTYRVVQELLDGVDTEETRAIRFLEQPLKHFEKWTKLQQKLRDAKGSLRMQSIEKKFVFDDAHEVSGVVDAPRYFSQTLIEETALAANQAVGDLFRQRGLPTIYRVHPEKDPDEVEAVAKALEQHGIRVPKKDRLTGRDVGQMIRAARKRPNAEALIQRIMGLVERAVYEVRDHEDVAKHFGLALEAYLHFTSPIRRYPDLVVHRWLWALESRGEEAARELSTEELVADLNDVAAHASMQAEVAEMAEQAVGDLKVCQLMEPHIGERLEARVMRVSRAGLDVHLGAFNVFGFLPARELGDMPKVRGPTLTLRAGRRNLSFTEGYGIKVLVKDVDFIRLQVLLELAA
jgi:ribonuclease R